MGRDGLVGLIALSGLGAGGRLILSDISEAALAIPREIFNEEKNKDPRVEFLIAGAENHSMLKDGSVDRVIVAKQGSSVFRGVTSQPPFGVGRGYTKISFSEKG